MTPKELAIIAAKALDEKKGKEISAIEITDLTTLADYFVIATGTSNTQINALCGAVEKAMKEQAGEDPLRREGYRDGTWVLLDTTWDDPTGGDPKLSHAYFNVNEELMGRRTILILISRWEPYQPAPVLRGVTACSREFCLCRSRCGRIHHTALLQRHCGSVSLCWNFNLPNKPNARRSSTIYLRLWRKLPCCPAFPFIRSVTARSWPSTSWDSIYLILIEVFSDG